MEDLRFRDQLTFREKTSRVRREAAVVTVCATRNGCA